MKALVADSYGSPDVLKICDVPEPVPGEDEVLVRVHFTTVNRTDTGILDGTPWFARLVFGLMRPKVRIRGCEFSGEVRGVGAKIDGFAEGDRVFGFYDEGASCHAEYVAVSKKYISKIPEGVSYAEAAPCSEGPFYAQAGLMAMDYFPATGKRILINGVSGGIGTATAQIAIENDAEITGVCGTNAMERVNALGIAKVIDYQKEDVEAALSGMQFDFFLDTVGNIPYLQARHYLAAGGIYSSSELGPKSQNVFAALRPKFLGGNAIFPIPGQYEKCRTRMQGLLERRAYKAVIDQTFAFEDIIEAYRYVKTGQKTGNVLVEMPR